jgi:hypothetical protein
MYQLQIDIRGSRLVPIDECTIKKLIVIDKKFCIDLKNKHYYDIIRILKDTSPQDNKGVCFVEAKHSDNCLECRKINNLEEFNKIEEDILEALYKVSNKFGFTHINIPIQAVEGYMWLDFKCENNIIIPKYHHWWQTYGHINKTVQTITVHNIKVEIFAKTITNEELKTLDHRSNA